MKKRYIYIFVAFIAVVLIHSYVQKNILSNNDDKFFNVVKSVIPEKAKNFIKQKVFYIAWLKFQIQDREAIILDHEDDLKKRYKQIGILQDLLLRKGIEFTRKDNISVNSKKNKSYNLKTFYSEDLLVGKHLGARGTSYIDIYENNFYLVTATGRFFTTNLEYLNDNSFSMNHIKSNVKNFINSERFLTFSKAGIKDILIKNDKIFISFTRELKKDCFITGLLVASLNSDYLNFNQAYNPSTCVDFKNSYGEFNFHHSGGRIFYYDDENVIFTSGEYRFRPLAQKDDNELGKILLVNYKNGSSKILSLGHRNPQGLFYDKNSDTIVSTEHGPMEGDELNIVKKATQSNEKKNYGWPISSYGEHYGVSPERMKTEKYKKKYALAPLNKSHKDFGFIEPIKYWVPGIAPSQIVKVSSKFENISDNQNLYYFGSMGKNLNEGDLSLHRVEFDTTYNKIISEDIIPLSERIRDVVFDPSNSRIIMFMETSGQLGLISKIN